MTRLIYFIREAFRALVEAKMMTFVSIITVAITLFFLITVFFGIENLERWVDQYNDEATVVAYLELTMNEADQQELFTKISALPEVESTRFISRSEAYRTFASLYGKELLSAVEENPFPASVEIVPADTASMPRLEKRLTGLKGVESVSVSHEWLASFEKMQNYLKIGAAVLIVVILLALYFTITNTIKLTVYARQELIRNMQYVGATYWYIRTPFLLEGMIQGIIGSFIAWCGIEVIALSLSRFSLYWGGTLLLPLMLLIGAILGFAGSLDAVRNVRKFLK